MYLTAHCFAKKIKIDKSPIFFKFDDTEVKLAISLIKEDEGLILEIKQKVDPKDLMFDKDKIDPEGKYIEKRLKPYRSKLHEIATLVEGLLSFNYIGVVPPFETHKIMVSVYLENEEERKMIEEEKISRGFGDVITSPKYPFYQIKDNLFSNIEFAKKNLPALSFLTQAIQSQDRKDEEIAFFLYFKIIEGYFGDGTPHTEQSLLKNKTILQKYLKPHDKLAQTLERVLTILKLPSRAKENYEGIISDLVLLRHKLTHFSDENPERYFHPDLKFELDLLNKYLRFVCMHIIRSKISIDDTASASQT